MSGSAAPGASYVMAAFTHLNPKGSRFSDGSFGVYYAAGAGDGDRRRRCFISRPLRGTAPIRPAARICAFSSGPSRQNSRMSPPCRPQRSGHDPRSRIVCRVPGLRETDSGGRRERRGLSERAPSQAGNAIGAFRPRAVGIPHQERHLKYRWNGERVDRYFDYARDQWIGL